MVFANRVRTRVLLICDNDWTAITKLETDEAAKATTASAEDIQKQKDYINTQKFWIQVNKAEAHFGLGNFDEYRQAIAEAKNINHAEWMFQSFREQIDKLKILLARYGNLLETPWVYEV